MKEGKKRSMGNRKRKTKKVNYNEITSSEGDDSDTSTTSTEAPSKKQVKLSKPKSTKIVEKEEAEEGTEEEWNDDASSASENGNANGVIKSEKEDDDDDDDESTMKTKKTKKKVMKKSVKKEKTSDEEGDEEEEDEDEEEDENSDDDDEANEEEEEMELDEEDVEKTPPPTRSSRRGRRKKKASSDEEDDDSDDDSEVQSKKSKVTKKAPRKKRGAKKKKDEKSPKKSAGRREIKTILKSDQLKEETKDAEKQEEERRKRLQQKAEAMRAKMEPGERVILQTDPTVEVHPEYARILKPHQVEGVQFIWDNLIESTEQAERNPGGGAILAHCMGLGKTLQTIVFTTTVLNCPHLKLKTCLIVTPLNTLHNWMDEYKRWTSLALDQPVQTYSLMNVVDRKGRIKQLEEWQKKGGVMIIGYEMFRRLAIGDKIRYKPWRVKINAALLDPGPDMIVCDEGHRLKNAEASISVEMNKIKSRRRLILTGTPLQNNLAEYHCMVSYVKPNLLGSIKEFRNRFVNPIVNGQHLDSTMNDVGLMRKRSHVLFELLRGFVQRKDYTALAKYLCEKHEYIVKIRLSKIQTELYREYLEGVKRRMNDHNSHSAKDTGLFADYQALMRVWTHPRVLQLHTKRRDEQASRFIYDESEEEAELSEENDWENETEEKTEESQENGMNSPEAAGPSGLRTRRGGSNEEVQPRSSRRRQTRKPVELDPDVPSTSKDDEDYEESADETGSEEEEEEVESDNSFEDVAEQQEQRQKENTKFTRESRYQLRCDKEAELFKEDPKKEQENTDWYGPVLSKYQENEIESVEVGAKIAVLLEILDLAFQEKDKVLVFSQSLLSLDLIEEMLKLSTEKALQLRAAVAATKTTTTPSENGESQEEPAAIDHTAILEKDPNAAGDQRIWHKNVDYFRMDGSCLNKNRHKYISEFNDPDDIRSRLFLISTKAGSLGVNLVAANRVIVFDASWNPSHDLQSIFRVYRFGQTKKCYIYRLIAQGTMEEKIYERQVTKQSLAYRVVDEQQISRHFKANELQELYRFTPIPEVPEGETPAHALPKDGLLADLLTSKTGMKCVASYHRHDSLLDHREDEELTEEERKAAWSEYNQEKKDRLSGPRMAPAPRTFQVQYRQQPNLIPNNAADGQDQRSSFCFLTQSETEELEKMKRFHLSMGPFFNSVSADKQIFVDSLFALLLKLKRNIILGSRKLQNLPLLSHQEAMDSLISLRRMNSIVSLNNDLTNIANSILEQRAMERRECEKKVKEQQAQFEWVLTKYQTFLSDTPVFRAMSQQADGLNNVQQAAITNNGAGTSKSSGNIPTLKNNVPGTSSNNNTAAAAGSSQASSSESVPGSSKSRPISPKPSSSSGAPSSSSANETIVIDLVSNTDPKTGRKKS